MAAIKTEFIHQPNFAGNVKIMRGDQELTVPFEDLERIIGERIRYQNIERLQTMKTHDLLLIRKMA